MRAETAGRASIAAGFSYEEREEDVTLEQTRVVDISTLVTIGAVQPADVGLVARTDTLDYAALDVAAMAPLGRELQGLEALLRGSTVLGPELCVEAIPDSIAATSKLLEAALGTSLHLDDPRRTLEELERILVELRGRCHTPRGVPTHVLLLLCLIAGEAARRLAPGTGWEWRSGPLLDARRAPRRDADGRVLRAGETLGASGLLPAVESRDGHSLLAPELARLRFRTNGAVPLLAPIEASIAHYRATRGRIAPAPRARFSRRRLLPVGLALACVAVGLALGVALLS